MIELKIKLAGFVFGIKTEHPSFRTFCEDYLTEEEPLFWIETTKDDIEYERQLTEEKTLSDYQYERTAVYRKIADYLVSSGVLMMHCSAVAVDGKAYLFLAPSGTGKSTHVRLWRELLGERMIIVNDDKPLIRMTDEHVYVCGTPWSGKHHLQTNVEVPIGGICILRRGEQNDIHSVDGKSGFASVLNQVYKSQDPVKLVSAVSFVSQLTKRIPLWYLSCNMDPDAARVSYEAMRGGRK